MSEEWGPWIEHKGGGCPVPLGTITHAVYDAPGYDLRTIATFQAADVIAVGVDWVIKVSFERNDDVWDDWVLRYRIRKPRALQQLKDIAENLPATPEKVTA